MCTRLALIALAVMLSACQSPSVNRDFDPSRDFASYRTWSWKEPGLQYRPDDPRINSDLTESRIRQAVSEQLEQRGLRQATNGTKADVNVQTYLIVDTRQQQLSTQYAGGWGGYWGGYWGAPMLSETRNVEYKVATVQIDLLDGRDGKLVWRGSSEKLVNDTVSAPGERDAAIRKTVAEVLQAYPPH